MNAPDDKRGDWKVTMVQGLWDPKFVIASITLLVSIFALVNAGWRSEDAFRPLLDVEVGDSRPQASHFGLFIRNHGMRPAKITGIRIHFDRKRIGNPSEAWSLISRIGFPGEPIGFELLTIPALQGTTLGAGQEILLFGGIKDQIPNLESFGSLLRRISVSIEYVSTGGKVYEARFPSEGPTQRIARPG